MAEAKTLKHDTWFYDDKGEGQLFPAGDEQPGKGWFDHPEGFKATKALTVKEKAEAAAQAEAEAKAAAAAAAS